MKRGLISIGIAAASIALAGCAAWGPISVDRDRFDYTNAIADSWKRQMLINIVKIRYGDAPVFLDVASVINQYEVQTNLSAALGWSFPPASNSQNIGGGGHYIDRPTITYNPMTGEKFARSLMTPIAPATIMSMVEGGYPIDMVFRLLTHSVNGIQNQFGGAGRPRRANPEFFLLLEKLRNIQTSGVVAIRKKKIDNRDALVMIFHKDTAKDLSADYQDVRRMLGLKSDSSEYTVVYGSVASHDTEIALLTRSFNEVLFDIASTVQVPEKDIIENRVNPTMASAGEGIKGPMIRILYSREKAADAFAQVPYRDHWFWIDDRDIRSKSLFSFLMFIMTLTETGGKEGTPIVTISAGG